MDRIPILKLGKYLLVTVQVDMHDRLALTLQDDLTERIVRHQAKAVLIDISALGVVDSFIGRMLANIAAMSRGLVYVEVVTRADLRDRADKTKTDTDVHVRNDSYYRGILAKHFLSVGCGLWWAKDRPPPFWELEIGG